MTEERYALFVEGSVKRVGGDRALFSRKEAQTVGDKAARALEECSGVSPGGISARVDHSFGGFTCWELRFERTP